MNRLKNPSTKCTRYDPAVAYDSDSDESYEDEFDESDSEPSFPRPTYKGVRPRYPSKPVPRKTRYGMPMDTMSSTTTSSVLSSPLETTEDTTESNPGDLYTPIYREKRPMMMEQDISPVRSLATNDSEMMPPRLLLHREWRPQHTSTTTDMQPLFHLPKTNPRVGPSFTSSTPKRRLVLTSYNQVVNMDTRPKSYYEVEKDPNLFWDNTRPKSAVPQASYDEYNVGKSRPEEYGLPPGFAKNKIPGILLLETRICGSTLTVNIKKATYFIERHLPQVTSYIRLEIRDRKRSNSHSYSRKRPPSESDHRSALHVDHMVQRTHHVRKANNPQFCETFRFKLELARSHRQVLFISAIAVEKEPGTKTRGRMLGCMTFPISRMLHKARDTQGSYYKENHGREEITVNDGGFFLLDKEMGEKNNFPQHKIHKSEYYEDPALSGSCGMTLSSYSSSNLTSSRQMPMEEFVTASRQFGSSMVPGYSTAGHQPLDNSSASSSSSYPHYNGRHRQTYPNINIITSDSSEQDGFSGISCQPPTDMDHLYADNNMNERKYRRGGSPSPTSNPKHVRRATSFTFSPKDTMDKYNKRPPQVKDEKKKSGPLAKFFSVLRNKKDSSSTSSLYLAKENCPSREEIYDWENNFELLLKSELGCQLFRSFLLKEHSDENWEFWSACEEFKRMKEGEKSTQKRAHEIYTKYIQENAEKQVNLDSDTRAATKAALETACRTDTFNLAQTQIEHLMKTDTYKRFLQDPIFLDLKQAVAEQRPASTEASS